MGSDERIGERFLRAGPAYGGSCFPKDTRALIDTGNLKNKIITFLGVTFKPNTDDMREATSIPMIKYLNKKNSKIKYYDPSGEKVDFKDLKNVNYCNTISSACLNADMVILHTEWNDFKLLNFKKLVKKQRFKIYDMRNMYSPLRMKKLNIDYYGVGR